ncbi:MAG: AMP-binding protein, partial [Acidobacteriota bacterium]|nr:AMP-binding protein [Acidobacteriota bacterium]
LVLRTGIGGRPTGRQLVARVREVTIAAASHQDLPFEKLVVELRPERSLQVSPLFQVLFTFEAPSPAPPLAGLVPRSLTVENETAKFDLTLSLADDLARIGGVLEYNADLFDRTTAMRLAGHFSHLATALVECPESILSEAPLVTAAERHQVVIEWNDTRRAGTETTLDRVWTEQAARTPRAVAVWQGDRPLTYAELDLAVGRLADRLAWLGVGPELPVGIFLPRTSTMIVALLAVLRAGGAYVPLDPAYPRERLALTLEDCRAPWVLTTAPLAPLLPESTAEIVLIDRIDPIDDPESSEERETAVAALTRESAAAVSPSAVPAVSTVPAGSAVAAVPTVSNGPAFVTLPALPTRKALPTPRSLRPLRTVPAAPANLAYCIYTSGSTGRPKGVAIEHRSAVALIEWALQVFAPAELAGVLASTSICFDMSIFELFVPLAAGGSVVLAENALDLPRGATFGRVTLIDTVPSAAVELVASGRIPPSVHTLNLGGEPVPEALAERLGRPGGPARVLNLYGPSETTTFSTLARVRGSGRTPIGRPIAGTEVLLLDRSLSPVPVGVPGFVYIGGAGLARGYLGDPVRTAASFLPHPFSALPGSRLYRTGDLARTLADGQLDFLGRSDGLVKVRGFRIELAEVEGALLRHPAVAAAAVAVRDGDGAATPAGDRLVAYLVPRPGERLPGAGELREHLRQTLPEFMLPSAVVELPRLPSTSSGKVDRA